MIVVLHNEACLNAASHIQTDLQRTFQGQVDVRLCLDSNPMDWNEEVEWNDLLMVLFDGSALPDGANDFISTFLQKRPETALLLPVAINDKVDVPPGAAAPFKALPFGEHSLGPKGNLIRRAGAMLGLRLQGRETQLFISYRAVDGTQIADQIYLHLEALGHKPYRDQAKELDGYTKILPGNLVQNEIEEALSRASMVLLVDTPESSSSKWIKEEINTADGMLIPILPIVFRPNNDTKKGPRFKTLLSLQRWVDVPFEESTTTKVLSSVELERITQEIETYLCAVFIRRCRVPFLAEKNFRDAGYDWRELNRALQMFTSYQRFDRWLDKTVHSHCSIFDQSYDPARLRFKEFLAQQAHATHALFIYDGELWGDDDVEPYFADRMIALHHQELSALLASHFTKRGNA